MFDAMNSPNRNLAIVRAVRDQGGTPTSVAKEGVRFFVCGGLVYK